jgi:cytidine deaminase
MTGGKDGRVDRTDDLLRAALVCRDSAYAPYSKFKVGAAIRAPSGALYVGCNVENASYPLGLCAEAGAIAAMIAAGETQIVDILIVGGAPDAVVPPCGACRQRIHEFADASTRIILADAGGARRSFRCEEMLPHAFDLRMRDVRTP